MKVRSTNHTSLGVCKLNIMSNSYDIFMMILPLTLPCILHAFLLMTLTSSRLMHTPSEKPLTPPIVSDVLLAHKKERKEGRKSPFSSLLLSHSAQRFPSPPPSPAEDAGWNVWFLWALIWQLNKVGKVSVFLSCIIVFFVIFEMVEKISSLLLPHSRTTSPLHHHVGNWWACSCERI